MNMQALMKQAQNMQRDINNLKKELDNTVFTASNSMVEVEVMGDKRIKSLKILPSGKEIMNEDITMLEDMILLAFNDAFEKIDKKTEEKMGKYSNMMPGLM